MNHLKCIKEPHSCIWVAGFFISLNTVCVAYSSQLIRLAKQCKHRNSSLSMLSGVQYEAALQRLKRQWQSCFIIHVTMSHGATIQPLQKLVTDLCFCLNIDNVPSSVFWQINAKSEKTISWNSEFVWHKIWFAVQKCQILLHVNHVNSTRRGYKQKENTDYMW